jgi:hypothetical protein
MLYQLSHVRMPVPSHPGPVRRIAPALRQNCIRSWPNHQLRTEAKAKNPSLERTRPTPSAPLPQVSRPNVSPTRPKGPHTTRSSATPGGRIAASHERASASTARARGRSAERESPRQPGQISGRGAPISSPVTRASAWGAGGTQRVGLHAGTWGRSPYRGPGGRPRWGNGHGGMAGGWVERGPRHWEEGDQGDGGRGRPPWREVGGFPRPVTGARAGKLVLPRPA